MTGYFYGSLFFTPIDVPFFAAMTWATLAIVMMTREVLPSWRATAVVGLLTGLAIATRTGGIITHAYLFGAMCCASAEFWARHGRLTLRYIMQMGARYAAVVVIAWITAIALWPWLQIGNPWQQFKVALVHFANIPMSYEFSYWGERIWTDAITLLLHPGSAVGRLPEAFLFLLAVAFVYSISALVVLARETTATWRARPQRWPADRGTDGGARSAPASSYARPLSSRLHSSSFSAQPSMTEYVMCCSSFPCLR